MSEAENLDLVHKMYVLLNTHNIEGHDMYWTTDMIWHGPPGWDDVHGLVAFKNEVLRPFFAAFPDYHAINTIEMTDGNMVAATGYFTGTHSGDWFGVKATGRKVNGGFSDFWRIENGRLAENWVMVDMLGILRQLGVYV
jgi:predicted ester cyclase